MLQTVSKRVDGMREALEKAEAERDACKSDASAGKIQAQALQAQVLNVPTPFMKSDHIILGRAPN